MLDTAVRIQEEITKGNEISMDFTNYLYLSQLWILGSYEAIRTLGQRTNKNSNLFNQDLNLKIKELKKEFERVRIPLAKMEPSRDNKKDYAFPNVLFKCNEGIAWEVYDSIIINRKDLADKFLKLIKELYEFLNRKA